MRGFISISKPRASVFLATLTALLVAGTLISPPFAFAAAAEGSDRNASPVPEEDDFSDTPYTEYGEFNEEHDEVSDARFYQYGRFFGVSLGLGYEGATGNRGVLWSGGGFPVIDIKVHYWFDFNIALDLGITTASHYFTTTVGGRGTVDANIFRFGVNVRYAFDTKNVAAPISFASPFVSVGVGSYSKTEVSSNGGDPDNDSSFGISFGGGLEFVVSPRKTYFLLEGKFHMLTFKDTNTGIYQSATPQVDDLNGLFYTFVGSFMFTW